MLSIPGQAVGILAMLIALGTLLSLSFLDRVVSKIASRIIFNLERRDIENVPQLEGQEFCIFNWPRTIRRFRSRAVLVIRFLVVLCALLLIAEFVIELGLGVREKCKPVVKYGPTISTNRTTRYTDFQLATKAIILQNMKFHVNFSCLSGDIPMNISPSVNIQCESNRPTILSNCKVGEMVEVKKGKLEVGVRTTDSIFQTKTVGIRSSTLQNNMNTSRRKIYFGSGDLTSGNNVSSIFLFHSTSSSNHSLKVIYFEYPNQQHVMRILRQSRRHRPNIIWRRTKSSVYKYTIECEHVNITAHQFEHSLRTFRSVQVEDMRGITNASSTKHLPMIKSDDVYRSILTLKLLCEPNMNGRFKEFHTCATYDWRYFIPFASVVVIIILTSLIVSLTTQRTSQPTVNDRNPASNPNSNTIS